VCSPPSSNPTPSGRTKLTAIPDVKVKVEAATQLRDNLEHYITGNIYHGFLKKLMPIFIACLKGPPVFVSTSAEQVGTLVQAREKILIFSPETSKLRSRNPAQAAYEPPRALRTICRGGYRFVDAPSES
jgi:hypothetical protein